MRGNQQNLLLFGALALGAYYLWKKPAATPLAAGASGATAASSGGYLPSYNVLAGTGQFYSPLLGGGSLAASYYQAIGGDLS